MKCPYCGAEMEEGVIRSANEISWHRKKFFFSKAAFHDGSVALGEYSFFKGSAITACLCRSCQKVVIDYADSACDLNKKP